MRYSNKREIVDVRNRNKLINCKKKKQEQKKFMNKNYYYVIKILIRNSISEDSKS